MKTNPPSFSTVQFAARRLILGIIVVLCCVSLMGVFGPAPAQAQSRHNLDIVTEVTPDESLRYHFPRRFEPAVRILQEDGTELFHELERQLGLESFPTVDVWLLPDLNLYFEIHGLEYRPPKWAIGLSLGNQRTVLVMHGTSQGGEPVDLKATFAHELAHVAIDEARAGYPVPRWFNEGFAIMHADEWTVERSDVLTRAAATNGLIPFSQLDSSFPPHHNTVSVAYAQSFHFLRSLKAQFGDALFADVMRRVRQGEDFYAALEAVTGTSMNELEGEWRTQLEESTTFWSVLSDANVIFFGATLLFLVVWVTRRLQRKRQMQSMTDEDDVGAWDYDATRYPLPGDDRRS